MNAGPPPVDACQDFDDHVWVDDYYGTRCQLCGLLIPHGTEPWAPDDDVGLSYEE